MQPQNSEASTSNSKESNLTYVSLPSSKLFAEREFPGPVYLCLQHKMVRYKNKGDILDAEGFNKLVYNKVKLVFIEDSDRDLFKKWVESSNAVEEKAVAQLKENPETAPIVEVVQEARRAAMDLFENPKDHKQVKVAVDVSKKLVVEFMKKPYSVNNINSLQKYSKGCMDHSVNVSMLSVFLGLSMGYSHQVILENLAMGGLFHDIGKTQIEPAEAGMRDDDDPAMQEHPKLGRTIIDTQKEIPNEVRMIVAQHHEFLDGTGYPAKLKGLAVYDLARVVAIANIYDNLISQSVAPTLKERAAEALDILEKEYEGRLEKKKLEKAIKILRYSFL